MKTDFSGKNSPLPWIAGGFVVLLFLACGLTALLGAGSAAVLLSRITGFKPVEAALQDVRGVVEAQDETGAWTPVDESSILTAGMRVRTGSLSSATLAFYDGSYARIAANAELSIDQLDAPKNRRRAIVMTQWAGESEHHVAENHRDGSQYAVHSPYGSGEARGTIFQVSVTPGQEAHYYVLEGEVAVTGLDVTISVLAGQVTTILLGQPPLAPVQFVSVEGILLQTGTTWVVNDQEYTVTEGTLLVGAPQIGDWVIVTGRVLDDGAQVAERVVLIRAAPFNRFHLTGTVESIGEGAWQVNGQEILVGAETKIGGELSAGDLARVEGLVLTGGKLQATEIEKIEEGLGRPFAFTGVVEAFNGVWTVSGIDVAVDENTSLPDMTEGGALVEIKGSILEDGRWLASSIALVEDSQPRMGAFSFTGELESISPWRAAGIAFETRETTEIDEDLKAGDLVRVEGVIDENGAWVALEIERLDAAGSTLVLVGTVLSIDPWIVSGHPLVVSEATEVDGEIRVGMLVRVEILLQSGEWQVIRITPLEVAGWFPGCFDIEARLIRVDGTLVQLENWPVLALSEGVQVDSDTAPGTTLRLQVCFTEDMTIQIFYILVVVDEDEPPVTPGEGDKVTLCHKPDKKKGGHSITVSRSALPAHLGHGDYEGACR